MSDLKEQMKQNMVLRGFSPKTQYGYLNHVRYFQEHFQKPLEEMGESEIKEFLLYSITERKLSRAFVNTTYSALKFMYETTMGRNWDMHHIPRSKKEKRLPVPLSTDEIQKLFSVTSNLKHKTILMTTYGAGLRVSEVAKLTINDIDSKNMQILIRLAKGNVDRYSLLSHVNLEILRRYYREFQPKVWLFPGNIPGNHIHTRSIQRIFEEAKDKAGINKKATVHSLRHSFATHLLEAGVNIVYIQKLLGHMNIRTTIQYLHLVRVKVLGVKSPLDMLDK